MSVTGPRIANLPSTAIQPTQPAERVALIDALRGVALFGILTVNIAWFAQPLAGEFAARARELPALDRVASTLVRFFAESKFYSLFSLLFGAGMAIQMGRAQIAGAPFVPRYLRRLLALFAFGLAHGLLLWFGDILHAYALLGAVLLFFRNCRPQTLLIWASVLLGGAVFLLLAFTGLAILAQQLAPPGLEHPATAAATAPAGPENAQSQPASAAARTAAPKDPYERYFADLAEREDRAYARGSYLDQVVQRREDFPFSALLLLIAYPNILAMFLFGTWIARRGILHSPAEHAPWLRGATWIGLGLGIPLNVAYVIVANQSSNAGGSIAALAAIPIGLIAGPVLCIGYVATLARLWQSPSARRIFGVFAPVGRMALTNYLLQSIVCSLLFYSVGMGLYGKTGPAAWLLMAGVIFALQIPLSHLWLARFSYGPMEWAWRRLTYGPFRRQRDPA